MVIVNVLKFAEFGKCSEQPDVPVVHAVGAADDCPAVAPDDPMLRRAAARSCFCHRARTRRRTAADAGSRSDRGPRSPSRTGARSADPDSPSRSARRASRPARRRRSSASGDSTVVALLVAEYRDRAGERGDRRGVVRVERTGRSVELVTPAGVRQVQGVLRLIRVVVVLAADLDRVAWSSSASRCP